MDNSFNLAASAPVAAGLLQWKGKVASRDGAVTGSFVMPDSTLTLSVAGKAIASGVLVLEERWGSVTGCCLIQVPLSGAKGQFITTAFVLGK